MKHTITNSLAVLLLLAIGAVGCSKEETPPDNSDTTRTPITICVTDGGYAAIHPSTAQTRAMENEYVTEFTIGDQIGLYVVKPDGTVVSNNIPLTHNGTGWTGDAYWGGTGAKYFAYYPYQQNLSGAVKPSASDAAGFFAGVVSGWKPAIDQSNYDLYTASDLMIGSGTASKQADGAYSLVLKMTHAMALVVIETPTTKYTLSGDADYTWTAAAPDTKFYGFMPYSPTLGFYRYLVKPAQSGASKLLGSYKAGNTKEYEIEQNDIATANYAHYKVDGGTTNIIEETHTLQAGDFYLKDGSLLGKDASLTNAQKTACIGIVLKAGRDIAGAWKDDCDYKLKDGTTEMSTIHGYVLALHDANVCTWGSYGTAVGTQAAAARGFDGYTNTNKIKAFAQTENMTLQTAFPATYYATEDYEATHPSPDNTSGWFFPSIGQCQYWFNNKTILLASVQKVTAKSNRVDWYWYWSSSEFDRSQAINAWYVGFSNDYVSYDSKRNLRYVRSVLAF